MEQIKILIIDDEPLIRRAFVRSLRNYSLQVEEANNAKEGLHKIENAVNGNHPYKVVVIDGLHGLWKEVYEGLTKKSPQSVPILYSATIEYIEEAKEQGIETLSKPCEMNDLYSLIEKYTKKDQ